MGAGRLTDDIGIRMIEKARNIGIRNICVHKGLPSGRQSYEHSTCADLGEGNVLWGSDSI